MSLRIGVGAIGNLLGERPRTAAGSTMPQPVLQNGELAKLRAPAPRGLPRRRRCRTLLPGAPRAPAGLERALDELCRQASQAVWDGTTILILSDRGVDDDARADPGRCWRRPPCTRTWCARARATMCGLVVESRRAARDDALRAAARLRRRGRQPVPGAGDAARAARGRRARRADARRGAPALRQGDRQGPAEGLLEDGHLDRAELPRRADLRGRRARAAAGRPLLHRHRLARRRPRAARHRRRDRRARTRARFPPAAQATSPSSTPAASTSSGRAASTTPGTRTRSCACSGRCATTTHATLRGLRRRPRRRDRAPARRCAACSSSCPAAEPMPLEEVEPSSEIVKRFATGAMSLGSISPGGARDAGHRDEPPRRALQHRRGRRGRGALGPRPGRRPAALGDQAGGVGALRRDRAVPGRRRPAADQDGPGREARRGRPAAGPQGRRADRAAAPLDARRRADLAAAAPRHLLDRGPGPADPRPEVRSTRRPRSRSSSSPRRASARSPPASPRPRPSTSSSPATTAAPAPRRCRRSSTPACRGSSASPRRSRCWSMNGLRGRVRLQVDGGLRTGARRA